MQYPLSLKFKIAAIASQIYVNDANNQPIFYVKQKLFKLKENIEIYSDDTKSNKLYTVKSDRVIDFSPEFILQDVTGATVGSTKRFGRKSIWKSTYDITVGQQLQLRVTEANPWAKVMDTLLREVPILSFFSGYFFNPTYTISDSNNQSIGSLKKRPSFLESKYTIDQTSINLNDDQNRVFAALMMVVVLRERFRG